MIWAASKCFSGRCHFSEASNGGSDSKQDYGGVIIRLRRLATGLGQRRDHPITPRGQCERRQGCERPKCADDDMPLSDTHPPIIADRDCKPEARLSAGGVPAVSWSEQTSSRLIVNVGASTTRQIQPEGSPP